MKANINIHLIFFLLVPFIFISILYASFSTELMIDGVGIFRISSEIRITNIEVLSQINGAYETYSSEYNKDTTIIYTTLPELSSKMTYQITISNKSDKAFDLTNIIIENDSNTLIKYEIIDLDIGNIIEENTTKTFNITLSYDTPTMPEEITDALIIKYEFTEHIYPYVVASYGYTGTPVEFIAPYTGIYKLEVWGAQGGNTGGDDTLGVYHDYLGGKGGYSYGEVNLEEGEKIYVVVGSQGVGNCVSAPCAGGYNGGGNSGVSTSDEKNFTCGGGGATHISFTNRGVLSNYESYKNELLLVAGGGGGGYYHTFGELHSITGAAGGGVNGLNGDLSGYSTDKVNIVSAATGGTQTSGGTGGYRGANGFFGQGGQGESCHSTACGSSGGGGGYYGGGAAGHSGAGGGSGYIGEVKNASTLDGKQLIPNYTNTDTMIGNTGNGYAKITFIEKIFK